MIVSLQNANGMGRDSAAEKTARQLFRGFDHVEIFLFRETVKLASQFGEMRRIRRLTVMCRSYQ